MNKGKQHGSKKKKKIQPRPLVEKPEDEAL
jgi:hypothetical protein